MILSKNISLDDNDKSRILDCFTYLKDTYAPNDDEYTCLKDFISAIEKDELTKEHLQNLHSLGNGAELLRMVVKAYYKNDVQKYKDL